MREVSRAKITRHHRPVGLGARGEEARAALLPKCASTRTPGRTLHCRRVAGPSDQAQTSERRKQNRVCGASTAIATILFVIYP